MEKGGNKMTTVYTSDKVSSNAFSPIKYVSLNFEKEKWCSFKGDCKADRVISNKYNMLCFSCSYKLHYDIPMLISEKLKEVE